MTDVSVIIVSYNTKDLLKQCLASVHASTGKISFEVIVVDNHSADGSVAMVKQDFPQVKIIQNKTNVGFGLANNQAAAKAAGDYLWFLNSDTLIKPGTLRTLVSSARKQGATIASGKLINPDGSFQPQGGALPTLTNIATWMWNLDAIPLVATLIPPYQDRRNCPHPYGWLGGTALLVRRDVFAALQGFDDHIFMYGEDVELCYRAAQGDFGVHFFPEAEIIHLGQASGSSERSVWGEFKGLEYLYRKHKSKIEYNELRFFLKTGALLRALIYTITNNVKQRTTYVKAFKLA